MLLMKIKMVILISVSWLVVSPNAAEAQILKDRSVSKQADACVFT